MPRVEMFFAAKVNPDDEILKKCVAMNTGFDVASINEMQQLLDMGVDTKDFIFANPVKSEGQLKYAKEHGILQMTFDSAEELHKIKKHHPKADCVLRIATDCTSAVYNLSEKFGASMKDVPELLAVGKKLNLRIKGVAFHTGSGGVTIKAYRDTLQNARKVFDMASGMGLEEMDLLDIGGGFTLILPNSTKNFEEVAPIIGELLDELFPEDYIRVIAEPGRYVVESVVYLASMIIG